MKRSPSPRLLVLVIGLALLLGVTGGVTYAAFFNATANTGNSFSAAADWTAPSASASVIAKTTGYLAGFIRQGGTYYVYANVADSGNPPSGVATVTADVSLITSGQTAAPLTSGAYSVNGVSYNYRSAGLTADNPLAAGATSYSLTLTDVNGNNATQSGFSVTVDNTVPTGADIQTANGSTTVGKAQTGDTVTFTYSEVMEPDSVLAGWTGPATTVTVRLVNGGAGNDTLQVWNAANAVRLPFGTVNLGGQAYIAGGTRNFTNSTMVQAGAVITITLGNPSGGTGTEVAAGTMTWTPAVGATDAAGNACSVALAAESGVLDLEF
ncbi:MAG: hypothetical protein HYU54_10500 [Actinobacteria bacterium]|nr:hypothetical protein [Actinomycetota bacterium]